MTLHHGDCLDVMAGMEPESVDAIVTDPPYGLEFMGKEWDRLGRDGPASFENLGTAKGLPPERRASRGDGGSTTSTRYRDKPRFSTLTGDSMRAAQLWHQQWAEAAYRVAKPSSYLLAFGGTRTVHRMTCALEDAGWIIRDMLVWAYASGFPKSKASLKPAWEPIVMARKPGPLRMLAIDACRLPVDPHDAGREGEASAQMRYTDEGGTNLAALPGPRGGDPTGRWPANVLLSDAVFGDDYSRFFLVPKSSRSDREPVLGGLPLQRAGLMEDDGYNWERERERGRQPRNAMRQNVHPTVKPTDLMRHLVRLVTPTGGTVLDPFLGSGTTALAAEMEGFGWIGIEREAEYVAIAEARLNGTQRGLGLEAS